MGVDKAGVTRESGGLECSEWKKQELDLLTELIQC